MEQTMWITHQLVKLVDQFEYCVDKGLLNWKDKFIIPDNNVTIVRTIVKRRSLHG